MNNKKEGILKKYRQAYPVLLYFALKPLYFRESGTLQIADIVLLALTIKYQIRPQYKDDLPAPVRDTNLLFFLTLLYQAVVNAIWGAVTGDLAMNRRTLYYVFNYLAFSSCLYIGHIAGHQNLKRALANGCFYSALVTALGLLVSTAEGTRSTGFFNNPNQLGYHAVIMLAVLAFCNEAMSRRQSLTVLIISAWSVVASLSKAAAIAYVVQLLLMIIFIQNKRSPRRLLNQVMLISVVCFAVYALLYSDLSIVQSNRVLHELRERILFMGEENDSGLAYGRGYARVEEIGIHFLWGTGEGAYDRFVARHGTEVHSTFVSLLICYGVVGLISYITIIGRCVGIGKNSVFKRNVIALSGVFLYAITHNGIRNTLLWILLSAMLVENVETGLSIEEQYSRHL